MLVFAVYSSPRLIYLLDEVLVNRLGITYKITTNPDYFRKSQTIKLNYSETIIEGCFNIPAVHLLQEEDVFKQDIQVKTDAKWKHVFYTYSYAQVADFKISTYHLNFDVFAAIFFLLSRYEEYLPTQKDAHGRYKAENSLAFKNGFLETPLVDIWIETLKGDLKKFYPSLSFKEFQFQQINTIDIDFAYKYKGLSSIKLAKKVLGSLLRGSIDQQAISPPSQDPYDTYKYITKTSSEKNIQTYFFFLLADYGGNDKNLSPESPELVELFSNLYSRFICGIHPSYRSTVDLKALEKEMDYFKKITGQPPEISRNHFLKFKLPDTFIQLEKFNIKNDYSLAYSNSIGFRASTCFSFQLFNVHKNETMPLLMHPPCLMDVTLKNAMNMGVAESIHKIYELKEKVKQVNGTFISIWHNSSFDESQAWTGWDKVYEALFD